MLLPMNWLEWAWRIDSGAGVGSFSRLDGRIWRINANTVAGGTITFSYGAPNPSNTIVTLLPNTNFTVDPCGMFGGGNGFAVSFDAGIDQWNVEWIRLVQ